MAYLWNKGPLFIREIVELYPEPKPHFNTVATFVRGLETKGWLKHEAIGNSFRYFPTVALQDYQRSSLSNMVDKFFGKSYLSFVSTLVKDEKISTEELKELIEKIEQHNKK